MTALAEALAHREEELKMANPDVELIRQLEDTILNTEPADLPDVAAALQLVCASLTDGPGVGRFVLPLARAIAFIDDIAPFNGDPS